MSEALILQEVREKDNRELRVLAANGLLPLDPEDVLPIQIEMALENDEELAEYAAQSLEEADPKVVARFVSDSADESGLRYFALHSAHPVILEAILRRRNVPRSLLVQMASGLAPSLQEILILRQDAIVEDPKILEALEENPELSRHVGRRIQEYRELMMPPERKEEPEVEAEAKVDFEPEIEAEVMTAEPIESSAAEKDDEGWWEGVSEPGTDGVGADEAYSRAEKVLEEEQEAEGAADRGISEAQIRSLPIPDRLKLTRGASKSLRGILIKDPNPSVALGVLENNTLSESEVESVARNRSVIDDVLKAISRNRSWTRKYSVVQALTSNPKTPVHISIKLLPQLTPKDMKFLIRDRNIPEAVRGQARRLHQARTG